MSAAFLAGEYPAPELRRPIGFRFNRCPASGPLTPIICHSTARRRFTPAKGLRAIAIALAGKQSGLRRPSADCDAAGAALVFLARHYACASIPYGRRNHGERDADGGEHALDDSPPAVEAESVGCSIRWAGPDQFAISTRRARCRSAKRMSQDFRSGRSGRLFPPTRRRRCGGLLRAGGGRDHTPPQLQSGVPQSAHHGIQRARA